MTVDVKDIADDIEQGEEDAALREAVAATAPTPKRKRAAAELLQDTDSRKEERQRRVVVSESARSSTKKLKRNHAADVAENQDGEDDEDGMDDRQAHLRTTAELVVDLFESVFDSKWEVRHGALLALRQIFLASELIQSFEDSGLAAEFASAWLEECLVRCICVLALDQFVDYSADGSVSPVREVCAQVFGILLGNLQNEQRLLAKYLEILRALFRGSTWHACHGAMLGLKYLVLAHKSHAQSLVPLFFKDVLEAFERRQEEEEVMVLAAEMFEDFARFLDGVPQDHLWKAATLLWKALADHAASGLVPASAVRALSAWYNHDSMRRILERDEGLSALSESSIHQVVPLLHQPTRAVRLSAASCTAAMFQIGGKLSEAQLVRYFLSHLLLQLSREEDEGVRMNVSEAWKNAVLSSSKQSVLVTAVSADLPFWTDLLWSTSGVHRLDVDFKLPQKVPLQFEIAETSSASRVAFADAIGYLGAHIPVDSEASITFARKLSDSLRSASGERQCGALLAISRWAFYEKKGDGDGSGASPDRLASLQRAIGPGLEDLSRQDWIVQTQGHPDEVYYSEQRGLLKRVRVMEARIMEVFAANGVKCTPTTPNSASPGSQSAAECSRRIAENAGSFPYGELAGHPASFELAHFKRQDLFLVDETLQQSFARYYNRVQGLGSCAFTNLLAIPSKKSGFLVKALMDSLKSEENADFRLLSAQTMADFAVSQAHIQRKCVAKIVSNLCNSATALAFSEEGSDLVTEAGDGGNAEPSTSSEVMRKARVRMSGAEVTLRTICEVAGAKVFSLFPSLDDFISKCWASTPPDDKTVQQRCHLVCTLVPTIHPDAYPICFVWLERLAALVTQSHRLGHTRAAVTHACTSICLHARAHQERAMQLVYQHIFAVFSSGTGRGAANSLLGATMMLHHVVKALSSNLVLYIPSLVHYAMKAMSSQDSEIRSLAARAFAELVPLVPLRMDLTADTTQDHKELSKSLHEIVGENQVSRVFLESLLEGKAVKRAAVDHVLADGVSLRSYQHHGVDWLSFLFENSLHGVLADDMGLGKTLQTLAAIAGYVSAHDVPASRCLVVCPPVVTDHWLTEATTRFASVFTSVVDYSGSPHDRKAARKALSSKSAPSRGVTLIVTTYSVLRSEISFLKQTEYDFAVLDEAHLIRNPATSLFSAVQQLTASHRVALSGTPLQNNVADLWSLFEFLMPGYLGEFAAFRRDFVSPISRSRERNATPKQKEVAALAITRLHQRVLPFILRRTKSQVLKELPPKIISNVLVSLTPVQKKLYALACEGDERESPDVATAGGNSAMSSVLVNLHKLRKICVHPALVLQDALARQLNAKEVTAAADWSSSGKMVALRDLLVDACGIGVASPTAGTEDSGEIVSSQHRCLVFGHLKETLDVIEQMFRNVLPGATYRRLDGQTAQHQRAAIVRQFNEDPTIDVLLLTTSVGGLGLTLTGADTVVFMEHSWNPFVDLQAMDRAHRIGQRRVVRVFRLIVKESLEEHIMDLQAFKERVSTTVVTENDAQRSMNAKTTEVLSLLQSSSAIVKAKDAASSAAKAQRRSQANHAQYLPAEAHTLLGQLGELWDESQYTSLAFPGELGAKSSS